MTWSESGGTWSLWHQGWKMAEAVPAGGSPLADWHCRARFGRFSGGPGQREGVVRGTLEDAFAWCEAAVRGSLVDALASLAGLARQRQDGAQAAAQAALDCGPPGVA